MGSRCRILLVEDNPGDAWIVRRLFQEIAGAGIDLQIVADGEEALAYLRREEPRFQDAAAPDLVLLDLNLPRKGGQEVLREIRADAALSHLRVVILSSSRADADVRSCRELRADDYLVKAFDLDEQREALREVHHRWCELC